MIKLVRTLFFFFVLSFSLNAQEITIIDDLNISKIGEGKVTIYQDESIKNLVGTPILGLKYNDSELLYNQLSSESDSTTLSDTNTETHKNLVRAKGYRVQVYSGSDQRKSKSEAEVRKNSIVSIFPNMDVTVTYNSPVWRVKAGNFKTHEQASQALLEMRSKLPAFGREMYIVSDIIKIPVD